MNNKLDIAIRVVMWTLIVLCSFASLLYLLDFQLMNSVLFALSAGQCGCNIMLLNDTK
jgi:hypothetical protein